MVRVGGVKVGMAMGITLMLTVDSPRRTILKSLKDTVAIGYVHPNIVTEGFCRSLAQLCLNPANKIVGIISASNPRQHVARNAVIEEFLVGPAEWLMWIDTDMTFELDAVDELRKAARSNKAKAVTGLAFIFKRQLGVVIPNGYMWDADEKAFREIVEYEKGRVHEVDGTGTGFVLVHRDVFEAFPDRHWHRNWMEHPASGSEMGHDLAFFYEMTQNLGMSLVWHTGVKTGHIKHFTLDEDSFERYRESVES